MIQRILPVVIGITLLISGCAKKQDQQESVSFNVGASLLKVAHLSSPIADGSELFITVDGKYAGLLPTDEAMLLQLPVGEHEVGGYARSLIGRVTIPSLKVTTVADQPRFVAYRVARNTPLFSLRGLDPLPKSAPLPEKQVGQSEAVPVPEIVQLSLPELQSTPDNMPAASSEVTSENSEGATEAEQEDAPKISSSTDNKIPESPAASDSSSVPQSAINADSPAT